MKGRGNNGRDGTVGVRGGAHGTVIGTYMHGPLLPKNTGFADWLRLEWGSPIWKTATTHMAAMISATVFFALAAILGHAGYTHGDVSAGAFVLTLIGFGLLTAGGWLGGAVVFVHGMRVLSLVTEPTSRAVAPLPHTEKETAEGS